MREYGIAAPCLDVPEPATSRRSAERLAAVVPGAHVVVRHGHVENGFLGVGYRAGAWLPVERDTDGTSEESRAAWGQRYRPVSVRQAADRAACSVVFAPGVYPHVWAHEWIARSPVLVLRSETVRVELDLSGLSADEALAFIASFRATLDVYACLWEEWESRAEFDQARPYPIPPPVYGDPDDTRSGGDAGDVPGGSGGGA